MRFFSVANLWIDYDVAVGQRYAEYINGVWDELPTAVQRLCTFRRDIEDPIFLNDGELRELEVDLQDSRVQVTFIADGFDADLKDAGPRRWVLRYSGATQVRSVPDNSGAAPDPAGYGDHGADEIELIEPGLFEHRMLFTTGIEIAIRFASLEVESTWLNADGSG